MVQVGPLHIPKDFILFQYNLKNYTLQKNLVVGKRFKSKVKQERTMFVILVAL